MHLQRLLTILQELIRRKGGSQHAYRKTYLKYVYELCQFAFVPLTLWACGKYGRSLSSERIAAEVADFFIDLALLPSQELPRSTEEMLKDLQQKLNQRLSQLTAQLKKTALRSSGA